MDSPSAMSRFRAQHGLGVSYSNTGSSYIFTSKIKKILKSEITKEVFMEMRKKFFSPNTDVPYEVFIDRLISKIDGFSSTMLQYALLVYEEEGVEKLVVTLRQPLVKIKKASEQLSKETKDNYEFDKTVLTSDLVIPEDIDDLQQNIEPWE